MVYGVFMGIEGSYPSAQGTIRLVKLDITKQPDNIHGDSSRHGGFRDFTYFSNLQDARKNFEQLRRQYSDSPGVQFIDET
jgi:hypothetical protein